MILPKQFEENIEPLVSNEWTSFVEALEEKSPTSIRLNPLKQNKFVQHDSPVLWSKSAYYLTERPEFIFDPLLHAGTYYVQEASSMFVEQAFDQHIKGDIKALDLCAAPGGKSTHLLSLLTQQSLLVSNEVIKSRANILSENITKWGYPNVIVTNNDPADIGKLENIFDLILIDAPCSGEGMFRKDQQAIEEWSLANVQLCKERQQRIVANAWNALKPNGFLIYSTCTYNKDENENNIRWIEQTLGAKSLPIETPAEWNITSSFDNDIFGYHFFPNKTKGEGFFISILQKNDAPISTNRQKNKKTDKQKNATLADAYKDYLKNPSQFNFFAKNDRWFAFPKDLFDSFQYVSSHLRIVSGGVNLGEFKGSNFIPSHSLALSKELNQLAFNSYELQLTEAVKYLRNETFVLPPEIPKGYILMTYKGVPLGFIKNIGNRINNLYPSEWRIRKEYHAKNNPICD